MRNSLYALSGAIAFTLIGCGSSSSSPSTLHSVLVSDAYIVDATVKSGDIQAYEDINRSAGWYQFTSSLTNNENITVIGGVNDIYQPPNGKADIGEPYAPSLQAPIYYKNITPFTTMMLRDEQVAIEKYPNAYAYKQNFDFNVVKLSEQNLSIAKENAKAALELSAMDSPKRVVNLRIINGEKVEVSDPTWRFIVSLQVSGGLLCGGSLIDSEWVLTAAHCITGYNPTTYAGSYSLHVGGTRVEAEAFYPHPQYNVDTVNNDIGLIHLKKPITTVSPIALNHTLPTDESMVQVAGWGNTLTHGSHYPDDLMQVEMPVINFDTCNNSYNILTSSMFCAGYMDGSKDSCQGDSGGPLIQDNKLSGIVSFGGSPTQSCGAPNYPGVYTRVANFIDWIESHTGPLSSSSSSTSSTSSDISSSSSSSSSNPDLEEIFLEIDEAQNLLEINNIIIKYMGYYNGTYSE